jgi:hypothetical protein
MDFRLENRHRTRRLKLVAAVVGGSAAVAMCALSVAVTANAGNASLPQGTLTVPLDTPTTSTSTGLVASPADKATAHWGQPVEP